MIDRRVKDWDWNEPKRPYLEIPGRELYSEAASSEDKRLSELNRQDPKTELESISQEFKIRTKITKNEIFKLGELLCRAKKCCRILHQDFGEWVVDNTDFSYPTAHNFMNVYTQCMGIRDVAMHLPISVLYKISQPSFPEELRFYLLSEKNLEDISCNHVDRLYKKFRDADYNFSAVEGDVKQINRLYYVFRATDSNLKIFVRALRGLEILYGQLKYSYDDVLVGDPNEIEPEVIEINLHIQQAFRRSMHMFERRIKESEEILDRCHREIRDIKHGEI